MSTDEKDRAISSTTLSRCFLISSQDIKEGVAQNIGGVEARRGIAGESKGILSENVSETVFSIRCASDR